MTSLAVTRAKPNQSLETVPRLPIARLWCPRLTVAIDALSGTNCTCCTMIVGEARCYMIASNTQRAFRLVKYIAQTFWPITFKVTLLLPFQRSQSRIITGRQWAPTAYLTISRRWVESHSSLKCRTFRSKRPIIQPMAIRIRAIRRSSRRKKMMQWVLLTSFAWGLRPLMLSWRELWTQEIQAITCWRTGALRSLKSSRASVFSLNCAWKTRHRRASSLSRLERRTKCLESTTQWN